MAGNTGRLLRVFSATELTLSIGLIACTQSESKAQAPEQPKPAEVEQVAQTNTVNDLLNKVRDDSPKAHNLGTPIECQGVFKQGGAALCRTYANKEVEVGGISTTSDRDGYFTIGFDRDAPQTETIKLKTDDSTLFTKNLEIAPREYDVQRIDGLPPSQVSTFTDKQLVHIKASSARKKVGFSSRAKDMGFKDGFTMAVTGIKSSDFGNQRILNGKAKRPHYGVDIAAPEGTPIYAPADGIISLADDDLYFEGAMVLIDHGQGLISMYLHMSDIDVEVGQKVKRGDQIGAVGAKGRATGAHLCWRLKWRNRNLDPELLTQWPHD